MPACIHHLVVATTNRGKLEEFRALLAGMSLKIHTVDEVMRLRPGAIGLGVIEDGETFEENSLKKARAVAKGSMMMTLADDSGLEVDALEGRPGVHSARFAHARATDAENNAALLSAIDALGDPVTGSPGENHRARFRCVLSLIDPYVGDGKPIVVEGRCEGSITRTPRGSGGFGYDPLFVVEASGKTMAELTEAEKNVVSHRARAMAALKPKLEELLASRNAAIAGILGS